MSYNKAILDRLRSGDTSVLKGLSPVVALSLGLQLQVEEKGKAEETKVNFNKVGETIHGLNNASNATKPTGITFFKTDEATPQ
jgi:hypothetical protein